MIPSKRKNNQGYIINKKLQKISNQNFNFNCQNNFGKLNIYGECHRKIREGRRNFREDIKLFIGLPKQPLLELSPPVYRLAGKLVRKNVGKCFQNFPKTQTRLQSLGIVLRGFHNITCKPRSFSS